jgi:hypothetical protein
MIAPLLTRYIQFYILPRMFSIRSALILLVLAFGGCSDRAPDETTERFPVDPALLGPVYTDSDLRMRFQAPAQFMTADSTFLARARQDLQSAGQNDPYALVPSMVFAIPGTDARCFLQTFFNAPDADFDEKWREGYLANARARAGSNEFETELVERGELEILAVAIKGVGFLNRRFLFETPQGRIVQIDYLLPDQLAGSHDPAIDSSIGALSFF